VHSRQLQNHPQCLAATISAFCASPGAGQWPVTKSSKNGLDLSNLAAAAAGQQVCVWWCCKAFGCLLAPLPQQTKRSPQHQLCCCATACLHPVHPLLVTLPQVTCHADMPLLPALQCTLLPSPRPPQHHPLTPPRHHPSLYRLHPDTSPHSLHFRPCDAYPHSLHFQPDYTIPHSLHFQHPDTNPHSTVNPDTIPHSNPNTTQTPPLQQQA
jgi:hypothetical protein